MRHSLSDGHLKAHLLPLGRTGVGVSELPEGVQRVGPVEGDRVGGTGRRQMLGHRPVGRCLLLW